MRSIGTVKWYHEGRGFGFITPETGQQDCFVHHSAVQGDRPQALGQGDRVEFDLVQAETGPAAQNVTRLAL
jgi:CspA family cold shock protein